MLHVFARNFGEIYFKDFIPRTTGKSSRSMAFSVLLLFWLIRIFNLISESIGGIVFISQFVWLLFTAMDFRWFFTILRTFWSKLLSSPLSIFGSWWHLREYLSQCIWSSCFDEKNWRNFCWHSICAILRRGAKFTIFIWLILFREWRYRSVLVPSIVVNPHWLKRSCWVVLLHVVVLIVDEFHCELRHVRFSIENRDYHDEESEAKNLHNSLFMILNWLRLGVMNMAFYLNSLKLLLLEGLNDWLEGLDCF